MRYGVAIAEESGSGHPGGLATVARQPVSDTAVRPRLGAAIQRWGSPLLTAAAALVLALLQYGVFRLLSSGDSVAAWREQPMPPLHVEQIGRHLHVTWNRKSPAVAQAHRGLLVIDDGAYRKEVQLDVMQLRHGSVVYEFRTSDVNFRLDLEGNHATVTESLRVVVPKLETAQVDP